MAVIYTPIGYGVTDENGQCILDHDVDGNPLAHSYTGSGAGKVDIVASLDSEITDGSLVSETFALYDCLKYDPATSTNNNNIYYSTNVNLLTRNTDYSEITQTNDTQFVYIECSGNICIELDANVIVDDSNPFLAFTTGGTVVGQKSQTNLATTDNTWIHYKIEVQNEYAVFTSDYSSTSSSATITGFNRFRLRKGSGETFKFRNLMVYPI